MSNTRSSSTSTATRGLRRHLRLGVVIAAALVGGGIGGTGAFAIAAGGWQGGWHQGQGLARVQAMLGHALDGVGATTAQEAKVHDIVAAAATSMMEDRADHKAMREQVIALLRAPTIDRDAVEKLRVAQVAAFEARSRTFTGAVLDAADQLNPAQRSQLADRAERMMEHHGGPDGDGRGRHGHDGRDGHGPDDGAMDHSDRG